MRKILLSLLLVLLCGMYAVAQDSSRAELFAGYSYLHLDRGGGIDQSVPAGFNLDGTYYFARNLGLTADFQYHHQGLDNVAPGASGQTVSFHGGPRFKVRSGRLEPFTHALFGFTHLKLHDPNFGLVLPNCRATTVDCTDNAFSMKLGGGLDVGLTQHFAVRLGEFNYYFTKFDDTPTSTSPIFGSLNGQSHQNNFTFSAGIVIR